MHRAAPRPPDPRSSDPRPPDPPRCRVGVALGGGSARGYAHIGVLASLERGGLAPDVVVGTSFGAVVGALYSMGRSPARLRADAEAMRRRDLLPRVLDLDLRGGSLLRGAKLEAYLERLVEGRSFSDLHRTFAVVATDLGTGERVLLRDGPLAPALRASTSLPLIFAPVLVGGRRLLDGGIGSPVPLASLAGFDVDVAIGVGAGVEAADSRALRTLRRALGSRAGRYVCSRLRRSRAPGAWGQMLRAAALVADAFGGDGSAGGEATPDPAGSLQVHARPPISWLRFDRARLAILAGESAMEGAWPRLRSALRGAGVATAGD